MNFDMLIDLIERARGDIEHELGDFTIATTMTEDDSVELLATAGYDWCNEGDVIAVARLSSKSADARLIIDTDV